MCLCAIAKMSDLGTKKLPDEGRRSCFDHVVLNNYGVKMRYKT